MSVDDLNEAAGILASMLTSIYGTLVGGQGKAGADLYYAVGDLKAGAAAAIAGATIGAPLRNVFLLAVAAGAAVPDMESVRLQMSALHPKGLAAITVANLGIRLALMAEVLILSRTTFASRQDVDVALVSVDAAFEAAEDYAADSTDDPSVYQALIAAHAAVVRDLTVRARPLPQLITYAMPRILTSHALAQRLYGDASRCDELRAENKVIAPAFMPIAGSALSE